MKKFLLFDYDDTLVDTLGSRLPAIIEFCKSVHGVEISDAQIREIWGVPFDQMMNLLGCDGIIDKDKYLEISDKYPLKPFPESTEMLNIAARRHTLGILTSLSRPILEQGLTELGWNDGRFALTVCQEDTSVHKPDPKVFEPVIETAHKMGLSLEQVLYIGDRMSDARASLNAGIEFIGVARTQERAREFSDAGVPYRGTLVEIEREIRPMDLAP